MSLKLAARLTTLHPYKILDLQENDTATHLEDLTGIVPSNCIAIYIKPTRISGAGEFVVYPRSSSVTVNCEKDKAIIVPIENLELRWKNTTANDDWDIYLLAYFTQKRTR